MHKNENEIQYDEIRLRGCMEMHLRDTCGNVIERREVKNVVVTSGRAWVLQHIAGSTVFAGNTTAPLNNLAIGTGTTAPSTADTAMQSETLRLTIQNFTTSNLTSNPPSYRIEVSFATNQANTTLGEVGLFNSSAAGTMLAHATFGTVNKTTSNTLSISYTISA